MLKDSLYIIKNQVVDGGYVVFDLKFDAGNVIYRAHFPGHPITPGACLVQIVKELSEAVSGKPLQLYKAKNVKFLNIIEPDSDKLFTIRISLNEISSNSVLQVSATISEKDKLYAKFQLEFRYLPLCVAIPVYNNEKTVFSVVSSALTYCSNVIVINDGSTDGTLEALDSLKDKITLIDYAPNKGKGYALQRAFGKAHEMGFQHLLTMDADGQHSASDIPALWTAALQNPEALIVGSRSFVSSNMPKNRMKANRFSNFWFTLQTTQHLSDTQSGFRIYPLWKMQKMSSLWNRYEAELDLLVRAAWRQIPLTEVPIDVLYSPEGEYVSHFRPVADFVRISLLNCGLCLAALVYGLPKMLVHKLFCKKSAE